MPTCPFCGDPLVLTGERQGVRGYACPAGGTRYVHQQADDAERWILVRDDGVEVCLHVAQPLCSDCAYPDAERLCLRDHGPVALADRPTLTQVRTVEALVIEGVAVDVEVSHHRCDAHGDDGLPHRRIRQ